MSNTKIFAQLYAEDIRKQNQDLMNNLAPMLSNIKSMSYNRATSPDDTQNAEPIITMKDADIYQPSKEKVHTGEIMVCIHVLCTSIFPNSVLFYLYVLLVKVSYSNRPRSAS